MPVEQAVEPAGHDHERFGENMHGHLARVQRMWLELVLIVVAFAVGSWYWRRKKP